MANLRNLDDIIPSDREMGYYEQAREALKAIPYAIRYRNIFTLAAIYAKAYHVISVMLGLVTAWLVISTMTGIDKLVDLSSVIIALLLGLLILMLLAGNEILKSVLLKSIFKRQTKKRGKRKKTSYSEWSVLSVLMLVSIAVSAIGGAFLTLRMTDQTAELEAAMYAAKDSIQEHADRELAVLDSTKLVYFGQNQWLGKLDPPARKQYNIYEQDIRDIKKNLPEQLEAIEQQFRKQILTSARHGEIWAAIAASIVLLFEILAVTAYSFQYTYWRNCDTEGTALHVLPRQHHGKPYPTAAVRPRQVITLPQQTQPTKIGFHQDNDDNHSTVKARYGYQITCDNCGKTAVKYAHNARFCSNECRYQYHGFFRMKQGY